MTGAPPELEEWVPKVLSPTHIREIEQRWPPIQAYQIDRLAEGYQADVDWRRQWRPSANMRDYLEEIGRDCSRLARLFASPPADLNAILRLGERRLALPDTVQQSAQALAKMTAMIAEAQQHLPAPAGPSKPDQATLFEDLRDVIMDAGYVANRSTKGPLIEITSMLLEALGVSDVDAASVVDYQLKRLRRLEKESREI